MFFKSLKKEILAFTLGLTILTIITTTVLGVSSTQTAGRDAEKVTEDVLREQAKESLVQIVKSAADQQGLLFEQIIDDVSNLTSYMINVRENPLVFSQNAYWEFSTRVFQKNGRNLNNTSDVSTIHIPSFVSLDSNEKRDIELTAYLDFVAPSILKTNQNIAAVWMVDDKGATRYFPNIILGNIAPPDYDPREDIFFKPATLQENPDRKIVWSALYDDPAGQGLMITASSPIYTKNDFRGVMGIDVLLNSIIENITAYSPMEESYAFLIDKEGSAIAFPDKAYKDILGRPRKQGEVQTSLIGSSREFSAILKEMTNGSTGFGSIHSGKEELLIGYAPLPQTGFSMAIVVEETIMLKAANALRGEISNSVRNTIATRVLPASLFIILLASIISVFLVARIVKPIRQLTLGAHEIGKGNLDYEFKVNSKNEIGELASSFRQMSSALKKSQQELYEYSQGLETQVKERTKELTIANSRLRELDRMKSEFVSMASHQLRTPLTATKGYISMLLEGSYGNLSLDVHKALSNVYASNERLVRIVNDLLDISRMERGKFQYTFAKVSLPDLLESAVKELAIAAEIKKLRILWEMPANPERFIVSADEEKLRQTFLNLLDNAIKYTLKGYIEIKIVQDMRPGYIRVSIKDTGIGISKEEREKLFEQFVRGKGGSHVSASGSGIGLYIAKKIVDDHHGRIWAESEGPGKGSTFVVTLPIYQQVSMQNS